MATNNDTRTLSPDTQQQLRVQIVKLRQSGKTNRETAITVGVSERHASVVWQRFLKEGAESLIIRERGRRAGQHRKMGDRQTKAVQELLLKKPCDVGVQGELWSRCRLKQALKKHLKIQVSIRTLGGYLGQWKMIPENPIDLLVTTDMRYKPWLMADFRNLEKRIEQERGELHWFAEKMVAANQKDSFGAFHLMSPMLATISRQGQIRFAIYQDEITPKLFREFLWKLITDVDKKVFLLVKKIISYHINETTEFWLEEHRSKIEVIYLPV